MFKCKRERVCSEKIVYWNRMKNILRTTSSAFAHLLILKNPYLRPHLNYPSLQLPAPKVIFHTQSSAGYLELEAKSKNFKIMAPNILKSPIFVDQRNIPWRHSISNAKCYTLKNNNYNHQISRYQSVENMLILPDHQDAYQLDSLCTKADDHTSYGQPSTTKTSRENPSTVEKAWASRMFSPISESNKVNWKIHPFFVNQCTQRERERTP